MAADAPSNTLPFKPWFKVGWTDTHHSEFRDRQAMRDTVEITAYRSLGPRPAPTAEPVPGCPVRAAAWEAAYQRRITIGMDEGSAAALTTTTHGPRLVPREEPLPEPAAEG